MGAASFHRRDLQRIVLSALLVAALGQPLAGVVFVLDGVLEMHFADGRVARLEKHDSIYFDS